MHAISNLPGETASIERVLDQFRVLLDHVPVATLLAEPGGRILSANTRAEVMFAYAAGAMQGLTVDVLIPEHARASYRQQRAAYAAQPTAHAMGGTSEIVGLRADGTTFPAEVSLSPIVMDGAVVICAAVRDISDRLRIAEDLRASEERFRVLVDHSSDGIFVSGTDGRYQDVNAAGCEMLGYTRDELLRLSIANVLHPSEVSRLGGETDRLRGGYPVTSEWRFVRKDGTTFFGEVRARQLSDSRLIANVRDVSARREVEAKLRASYRFIETVAKASPPVIYVFDLDQSRLTYSNRSILAQLGHPELVHNIDRLEDLKSFIPPQEMPHLDHVLDAWRALEDGHIREDEYCLRDADGGVHWFHGRETVFARHVDGSVHKILGTLYDITVRKETERALEHSRALLQSFVENTPAAVAMLDRDLRYIAVSRRWLQDYGLGERNLRGLRHYDVFPEIRDMPEWQQVHQRSLAGAVERRERDPFVRADGHTDWLRWEVRPWRDEEGAIGGIIMSTEVITDRVQAEARLHESQRHLVASQRVSGVGSWELDLAPAGEERRRRNPLRWSDQCYRLFGYEPGEVEVTSNMFWERVHPDDKPAIQGLMQTAIETGGPFSLEHRIVLRDGTTRVVQVQAESIVNPHTGKAAKLIGIVQDITERLRLEEQLRQSQKLQAVGQIAGGIAHDFNNALTVIGSGAEILLDHLPPDDNARDEVIAIRDATEHAASLTRQLLLFSRRAVLEPRHVDCNALVSKTIRLLGRVIGEDKILSVALAPGLLPVKADPNQIEQVVMNLALNARDAMPQGGRLTIETRLVVLGPDQCRDSADAVPGRFVEIVVSDTGVGMTPEVKAHVFEPFFTTKGPGKGTGLGLATVYGIVRESGGFVTFTSEPGAGTTFKVFLPVQETVEAAGPETSAPSGLHGTETVLLVEDDANVRRLIRVTLERFGYTVLEADDATSALDLAEAHKGRIDLLLSDVIMPGMSGRSLAEALRNRGHLDRVLFMSGYSAETLHAPGDRPGTAPLLHKPFTPKELAARVRDVLDKT